MTSTDYISELEKIHDSIIKLNKATENSFVGWNFDNIQITPQEMTRLAGNHGLQVQSGLVAGSGIHVAATLPSGLKIVAVYST